MSTLFPAAPVRQRTWFGRTANGLGLTCLLLAILAAIFANTSRALCGYSVLMVLLTAPLALLTVCLVCSRAKNSPGAPLASGWGLFSLW